MSQINLSSSTRWPSKSQVVKSTDGGKPKPSAEQSVSLSELYTKYGFELVDQALKNTLSDQMSKQVKEQIAALPIPQALKDEANEKVDEVAHSYKSSVPSDVQSVVKLALEDSEALSSYLNALKYEMQDQMENAKYEAERQGVGGNWLIKFAVQLGISVGRNDKRALRQPSSINYFESTFRDTAREVIKNIVDSLIVVARKR